MIDIKMKDFCKERCEREIVILLRTVMQWMIRSHCKGVKSDMVRITCQEK